MLCNLLFVIGSNSIHSSINECEKYSYTTAHVERLACMCITGVIMRTCPIAALEVILDLTPLLIGIVPTNRSVGWCG